MKSDGETPSKFWRPQDVWIAGRNNFGVRNPGQLNRSWREPEPSKLSYLGDSYDAYGGDRIGIKKIGSGNWPSKNPGRPSGPGRGNNPPRKR